jgi:taurine dioxygenase
VTVHAETGERILYVNSSFLKSIVGLTPRESQKILEILWEHITRPEYTVRFKWNEGALAPLTPPVCGSFMHLSFSARSHRAGCAAGMPAAEPDPRITAAILGLLTNAPAYGARLAR